LLKEEYTTTFLVEECKLGKEYAYKELYNNYINAMYNTAYRILQNRGSSEDKVQEAFITAFQKIETLNENGHFGGWLKRIVVNSCLNEVKTNKIDFSDEESIKNDVEDSQDDELDYPDLEVDQIKKAIAKMPRGYGLILNLFLFENYSHKEIAQELNITSSTSRTQYMRAKKKLKQLLLENHG